MSDQAGSPRTEAGKAHVRRYGPEMTEAVLAIEAQSLSGEREGIDVERLAEALHPAGRGPVVDCCMGSTVESIYPEGVAAEKHRAHHRQDAEALAAEYARLASLPTEPESD